MGLHLMRHASVRWVCFAVVIALFTMIPRTTAIEPAEGLIVFSALALQGSGNDLYTMRPDGAGMRALRTDGGASPTWSPDGTKIAFLRLKHGQSNIFIIDANGDNEEQVIYDGHEDDGLKLDLTWSPDKTRLAFTALHDGLTQLVIVTLDSSEMIEVEGAEYANHPSWSPDSSQIVFSAPGDNQFDLFVYDLEDDDITHLTETTISEILPDWSADGTRILFTTQARDSEGTAFFDLYTIAADGGDQQLLIENGRNAIWSPDNSEIAFTRQSENSTRVSNVYLINADGSNLRQISTRGDIFGNIDWQPVLQTTPDDETQTEDTPPTDSSNTVNAVGRIVFVSDRTGQNDIYTMNIDGSDLEQLTDTPDFEVSPVWSPDGTQIAFSTFGGARDDLYVMDADGRNLERITTNSANEYSSSWSPDGTKLVFASDRDGEMQLYVVTLSTGVIRRLIKGDGTQRDPAWSPDGTQIVFSSEDDGSRDIYVVASDGTDVLQLTNDPETEEFPRWSPDGTQIAFQISDPDDEGIEATEVYIMDADGENQRRLTDNNDYDGLPAWSLDGTQILFTSDRAGLSNLYLMNADGSDVRIVTEGNAYSGQGDWQPVSGVIDSPSLPRSESQGLILFTGEIDRTFELFTIQPDGSDLQRITDNDLLETSVAWSPDGTQIAFEGRIEFEDAYDLYVMDADGTNIRQLTDTPDDNEEFPAWSPDGTRIAFESDERGNSHIHVINADGSDEEQITRGSDDNQMASWTADGSQIMFASNREGAYNVYLMDADGGNIEAVTDDSRSNFYPKLSPDETEIVFTRISGENYDLYVMDADGSNRKRLYAGDRLQVFPNWSPDGKQIVFTSVDDEDSQIYIIDRDGENLRLLFDDPEYALYASWTGAAPLNEQIATPNAPDVDPQETGCRVIIKENLNLRETPETGRVLLTVPVGTEAGVIARSEDNAWWKIIYNETEGWVSRRFTQSKGTCDNVPLEGEEVALPPTAAAPTATPASTREETCQMSGTVILNVRAVPVTAGDLLFVINVGDEAEVIGRLADNTWYRVSYRNQEGWVSALLVNTVGDCDSVPVVDSPQSTAVPPTATANEGACKLSGTLVINVREVPVTGAVVFPIPIGIKVDVIARLADNSWYKVNYRGREGWVSSVRVDVTGDCDGVPVDESAQPPLIMPTATAAHSNVAACQISGTVVLNMRDVPVTGDVVSIIPIGQKADVIGRLADSSWYKVTSNDQEGWVSALLVNLLGDCDSVPVEEAAASPATEDPTNQVATAAGDLIAFSSNRDGLYFLYVVKPDGTGLRRIAESESGALTPAWSPDGTRIAFARNLFGNTDIYVANADGTNIQRITRDSGIDTSPTWSPDGKKIAYTSVASDLTSYIAVINVDGRLSQRLSETDNFYDQYPAWSPDGRKIAFISGGQGEGDVYVMDTDGSNLTRLTYERRALTPAWSPDGTWIAFALTRNGNMDIYKMDSNGNQLQRLTTSSSVDFDPSWSSDGAEIVYASRSLLDSPDLYVVDVESFSVSRLTDHLRDDLYPDWNPNPNLAAETADLPGTPTPTPLATQGVATTETFTDRTGELTFDYPSGSALGGGDEKITLTQGDNVITVYTPPAYADVMSGQSFNSPLEELKFFVSDINFTVIGLETDATSFGKELAHVSIETVENQKGTAFLVDLGNDQRTVVLWLTPPDQTLSAPMLQTLIKIMTTIDYSGDVVIAALPTAIATARLTATVTSTHIPTSTPTIAPTARPTVIIAPTATPVEILTRSVTDESGELTFDYLNGAIVDGSDKQISLIRGQDSITIYMPASYAATMDDQSFIGPLDELILFVELKGFTLVGLPTQDTNFGKALAHVSVELPGLKGTAFLVNLNRGHRTVVVWLTPQDQTLSAPMLQTLVKIMSTIEYTEAEKIAATPTVRATVTAASTPTATATSAPSASVTVTAQNGLIVFASENFAYGYDIYTVPSDGRDFLRLTDDFGDEYDPEWSPDGTQIVYTSNETGQFDIYVMDADGGNQRQLTSSPFQESAPSWSPDGTQIVYEVGRGSGVDLFVMNADGRNVHRLMNNAANEFDPAWSPGSDQIVFTSLDGDQADLYLVNTDGSNLIHLTDTEANERAADWSPDGMQLVFQSDEDGDDEIYVMDVNGSNIRRLTQNNVDDQRATWSPDGTLILFQSKASKTSVFHLYRMSPTGSALRRASTDVMPETQPDWQPVVSTSAPTATATTIAASTPTVLPTVAPTTESAEQETVMDVVLSDPELSTFATSIIAAGLLDELTSANGFQYTVFAPTNDAFDAMLREMDLTKTEFLSDPALLTAILSYHLLPGKTLSEDLKNGEMTTLGGERISINNLASQIFVNGASTIAQDLEAGNGVVYVIDEVLLPPALQK